MANDYYYNKGVQITSEEAHALVDKSGLVVADRVVDFDKEIFKGTKMGLVKDYISEKPIEAPKEEPIVEPIEEAGE